MTPASGSEGEIIEAKREKKANSTQPSTKNADVDDRGRHEPPVSKRLNDPYDPYPSRSRSRSRSPYRAEHSRRGEKRPRDEPSDRGRDARRFKVHYEDERLDRNHRQQISYADIDERHRGSRGGKRGDKARAGHKRSRSRSRSPFRHDKGSASSSRYDTSRKSDSSNRRDREPGKREDRNASSEKKRFQRPVAFVGGGHIEEFRAPSPQTASRESTPHALDSPSLPARAPANGAEPEAESHDVDLTSVDETALIEQRRRRREAIKAKFKGSGSNLLVQALQQGSESGATTPDLGSPVSQARRSASPNVSAPNTPNAGSLPDSPTDFSFQKGEELANNRNAERNGANDAEEPSAADYDPTMDMQEDRAREGQRHHGDQPSSAYDETREERRDILLPADEGTTKRMSAAQAKEFDMFADGDDDDMFAESPKDKRVSAPAKAVSIPQVVPDLDLDLRDNWDDQDGYYRFNPRDVLDGRFQPQANLGRGMFSAVFRAVDQKDSTVVAIKIIRNNETMRKAGYKEIDILKKLMAADPEDKRHLVRLVSTFDHRGHLCMVFENLSMNLREVLKKFGRDVGLNLKAVRTYARQVFLGLSLLKKCNILHADLKPDNILVSESWDTLKICDLGSAGDAGENEITPYLVSRFYRAPEIILGMEYSFPIDMWSIGCTLFELYTGKILFTGRSNNQMLKAIMECRGKFPPKMLNKGELRFEHFDFNLETFRSREKDKITGKEMTRMVSINKPVRDLKSRMLASSKGLIGADLGELNHFIDLLERCLQLRPEQRITPKDALEHRFFKRTKS